MCLLFRYIIFYLTILHFLYPFSSLIISTFFAFLTSSQVTSIGNLQKLKELNF